VGTTLPYGELQHAATYLGMARTLRGIGIGNIVWGAILLVISIVMSLSGGTSKTEALVSCAIFLVFSLGFIAEGVWLIVAPSSTGLLVAAISMFLNALLFGRGILILILLIAYGVVLIQRYKKYGPLMAQPPASTSLAQAAELLDKLQKAKRQQSPDLIEFNVPRTLMRRLWRGLLQDNLIVLVALETRLFGRAIAEVYFLPPAEISIEVTRKEFMGKWLKGTLVIADQKPEKGTIPPECFERFQVWQQQYIVPSVPSESLEVSRPAGV
jgi:hypothetical protein